MSDQKLLTTATTSALHRPSFTYGFVFACTAALLPSIALPFIFFATNKDRDDQLAALRQNVFDYMKKSEYGTIECFNQTKHLYCAQQLSILDAASRGDIERGIRNGSCILTLKSCQL